MCYLVTIAVPGTVQQELHPSQRTTKWLQLLLLDQTKTNHAWLGSHYTQLDAFG